MKRTGNLLESIADPDNLREAFHAAMKGKTTKADVIAFRSNLDAELERLSEGLLSETVEVGGYRQFKVYDPKERVITVAPFAQRVLHHAIMHACESSFERRLIHHTYACRKGKGRIAALDAAEKFSRTHRYFLKLDIRKYFDSVDHAVLRGQLERLFKDKALLRLLDRIIGSFHLQAGKGLPIGNLTSQHFANLYLNPLDRFVTASAATGSIRYIRYMDDMVIWSPDRQALCKLREKVRHFLRSTVLLELKQDRIGTIKEGVPFLGCRVFAGYRTLNRRSRIRFQNKTQTLERLLAEGRIREQEAQQRSLSLCSFARTACSYSYRQSVFAPHFRASAMGQADAPTGTSAAAVGTTMRTTAPSRTATTTTRTTGTTTTASASPAAPE